MSVSLELGEFLVRLARKAIQTYLKDRKVTSIPEGSPAALKEPRGVFVTLNKSLRGEKTLRGCIGFPEPMYPLGEATIRSAISAATSDPRFPPVELSELPELMIEVSILTPPQLVESSNPLEYPGKIEVGRDGLIIERGRSKGLLLPQVPVEWGWDAEEFLIQCCIKAGLSPESWLLDGTRVYSFQGKVFSEESPSGQVREVILAERNR
ncbi:TIGR00296 family protein [Candidatus Bathyarchaeota archaeon]|nr:TIGR00296 family protein [Candidatus Bathyarchaeota archaeon]